MKPGYKQTEVGVIPEDWETLAVADLADPSAPICYGVVQVGQHAERGVPIVAIKFVKEIKNAPLHRTAANLEKPYARSRPIGGDVLISIKGTIGRVGIVPNGFKGNISRELARLRIREEACPEYIAHQLESGATQERIMRSVVGTTRLEFSIANLRKFSLPMPPTLPEQRAIAEALSDVDGLLGGLDRLIAKKRDLKQAAMQQLLTGQNRLPGFHGEWEVKLLGDVAEMGSGGTPSSAIADYYDGDIPWVSIADMTKCGKTIMTTDRNLTRAGFSSCSAKMFPAGTVLYAMYASLGECSIAGISVCSSQAILGIRTRSGLSNEFLYYYLTSLKPVVKSLGQQGTQANLNKGMVQDFCFSLPPLPEQTAIATILSDMDAELTALEQRREKTRALKQAMMQELLTGRTRLV
jgi:type I restriction enzyme S subunit